MRYKQFDDPLINQLMEETYALGSVYEDKNDPDGLNFYFEDQNKVVGSKSKSAFFEFNLNKKELLFYKLNNLKDIGVFRTNIAGYPIDFPYDRSLFSQFEKYAKNIGKSVVRIGAENDTDKLIEVLGPFCPYDCEIVLASHKFVPYLIFVPQGQPGIVDWIETLVEL